jgi:Cu2+-containing amine oxidase
MKLNDVMATRNAVALVEKQAGAMWKHLDKIGDHKGKGKFENVLELCEEIRGVLKEDKKNV